MNRNSNAPNLDLHRALAPVHTHDSTAWSILSWKEVSAEMAAGSGGKKDGEGAGIGKENA
jgi:hypothetical protein